MSCCRVLQGHSKDHPYVEVWHKLKERRQLWWFPQPTGLLDTLIVL